MIAVLEKVVARGKAIAETQIAPYASLMALQRRNRVFRVWLNSQMPVSFSFLFIQ